MGLSRTKEYLFLGQKIMPDKAVEPGLASRVVEADALMAEAIALAHRLVKVPRLRCETPSSRYIEAQLENAFETAFKGEEVSMGSPKHAPAVAAARKK
jgi:enoyl-CoA hydratase